jgi:glycosyltransferase involved in cell wall biosynthesis
VEMEKDRQIYLKVCKILGRHPTWSEFEHLRDLQNEIEEERSPIRNNGRVFCDVTQFIKQREVTGIQRVVMSFHKLNVTNFQPIYFHHGNFYYFHEGVGVETGLISRYGTAIINKFKRELLRFGFQIWTRLIAPIINRNHLPFSYISKVLKEFRNKLLPVANDANQLSVEDLMGGRLFVPDLPADRSHLEALLVIAMRSITPIDLYVHDAIPLTFPELMPRGSTNEFNLYLKLVAHANRIFCSSDSVKKDIEKIVAIFPEHSKKRALIRIYPFPIISPSNSLPKLTQKESELFKQITDSEIPFVHAVGTILARKNYSLIVRALEQLSKMNTECNFYIFAHHNWGDDSFLMSLTSKNKKRVKIIQGASDSLIYHVSKKSVALVYPSLAEGYGLPVTEAFSNGIQVIVNNVEPMKRFAEISSLVHVAEFNSSRDWASKIAEILEAQEIVGNFQIRAEETWDKWAYEFVLENLMQVRD